MKIGELAAAAGVSTDTLRYYEKHALLPPPVRAANGYRSYAQVHLERVRFVRSAQSLGFSLAQVAQILPDLAAGRFGRFQIEQQLRSKIAQIDAQMQALHTLKQDLLATFASLTCSLDASLAPADATVAEHGGARRLGRAPVPPGAGRVKKA